MRLRFACLVSIVAACVFVGCGGGGGGSSSAPAVVTPTSTPAAIQLFLVPASDSGSPVTEPSTGQLGVNNLSISFTAVGQQQGILIYEPGFTGTFTISVKNCTPASPVPVSNNPTSVTAQQAVVVVTAASAGFCALKVYDGTPNSANILIDVTTTTGTISNTTRH
jgi:hypothetical protein